MRMGAWKLGSFSAACFGRSTSEASEVLSVLMQGLRTVATFFSYPALSERP
jgi:hypothetical protein